MAQSLGNKRGEPHSSTTGWRQMSHRRFFLSNSTTTTRCQSLTVLSLVHNTLLFQYYVFTTHTLVKSFTTIRLDYEFVATASTHTSSTPCLTSPDCDLIESFAHTHSPPYKLDLCFLQHIFALYYNKSRWASALSMAFAPNHHFHYAP